MYERDSLSRSSHVRVCRKETVSQEVVMERGRGGWRGRGGEGDGGGEGEGGGEGD